MQCFHSAKGRSQCVCTKLQTKRGWHVCRGSIPPKANVSAPREPRVTTGGRQVNLPFYSGNLQSETRFQTRRYPRKIGSRPPATDTFGTAILLVYGQYTFSLTKQNTNNAARPATRQPSESSSCSAAEEPPLKSQKQTTTKNQQKNLKFLVCLILFL